MGLEEKGFDHIAGLSHVELTALEEIKKRLSDVMQPHDQVDVCRILRFLRARDYELDNAESLLRQDIEWRKKEDMDNLLPYKTPEVVKFFPFNFMGYDREGAPVRLVNFGNMDTKGLLKSVTKQVGVITILSFVETDVQRLKSQEDKLGKHLERWSYIFDFENASLSQVTHRPTVDFILTLFTLYEAHYPERLKHAVIINASVYFTILFAVIKPLLSGKTLEKVKVFGKTGYQDELLNFIHPGALPMYLGGDLTDPDGNPRCETKFCSGGLVPRSYYFRSPERRLAYQQGVKKYSVSRMSKISINLSVVELGSRIAWEFETENGDIDFGLYFREFSPNGLGLQPKELIPKARIDCNIKSETGIFSCECPGTYTLLFDNSFSWFSQKELFCKTEVITPRGTIIKIQN